MKTTKRLLFSLAAFSLLPLAGCATQPTPVLELDAHSVSLTRGDTYQLEYHYTPETSGEDAVRFWSDNESVLSVSSTGLVTALKTSEQAVNVYCASTAYTGEDFCSFTVGELYPEAIALNHEALSLHVGDTTELRYTVTPSNAYTEDVTWVSSKPSVVKVAGNGIVTALSLTDEPVQITAYTHNQAHHATCTVEVTPKVVETITISDKVLYFEKGDTHNLVYSVTPSDGDRGTITWESSNPNIISVKRGVLTCLSASDEPVTIKATTQSGESSASVTAYSLSKKATDISFDKSSVLLEVGVPTPIQYSLLPEEASSVGIAFASSSKNLKIENGVMTANRTFETVIVTATLLNGTKKTFLARAVEKIIDVETASFDKASYEMNVGDEINLPWTASPEGFTNKYEWSNSNPSVVELKNGSVTALSLGTSVISITFDNGVIAETTIHVVPIPVASIELNETSLRVREGCTDNLTATVLPLNATDRGIRWTSSDETVATVSDNGVIKGMSQGTATITASAVDGSSVSASCAVEVYGLQKADLLYDMEDYASNNRYFEDILPLHGDAEILVVPMWVEDSGNFVTSSLKKKIPNDLRKAFFGTPEETGWESVASFYGKESLGTLNLSGVVTDWWEIEYKSGVCLDQDNTTILMRMAWEWYKENNDDYLRFDKDHDGFVDCISIIYALPDYQVLGNDDYSNLWAYRAGPRNYPGTAEDPAVGQYFWASYDFLYGKKKSTYANGDTSHCTIDTHTLIHEMGHAFGLQDYYDYADVDLASGAFNMQSYNVGAHDPASKLLLGWAKPYAPTETVTITLRPMEESGEVVLLSPSFTGSPFDEYILIEYYTPTGLNEFDTLYRYKDAYPIGVNKPGFRVYHADNRLTHYSSVGWSVAVDTTPGKLNYFAVSNTTYVEDDPDAHVSELGGEFYDYRQLTLIRKNVTDTAYPTDVFNENSLFYEGDTFDMTTYAKCFPNEGKLNSGEDLGWSVSFGKITSEVAELTLTRL